MLRQSAGQVSRQYAGYRGKAHLRIRRLPPCEGCVRWRRASSAALMKKSLRRNENALNEVVHLTSYVGSCGRGETRGLTRNLLDLHWFVLAGRK